MTGNTCPRCKTKYDAKSWAALPLVDRLPEHPTTDVDVTARGGEQAKIVQIRKCTCGLALTRLEDGVW